MEMDRKKDERMIYIKDLIFAALYRWRSVLIVALVLALVLGGWKGVSGLNGLQSGTEAASLEQAQILYEAEKTAAEKKVASARQNIENQRSYLENSVLMQIDPYSCYEAVLSMYVETDYQILPGMSYQNPDKTASAVYAYQSVAQSSQTLNALAQALGSQSQYVSELLIATIPEETDGTLEVRIATPDEQTAWQLLEVLQAQLEGAYDQVAQAVTEHTVRSMELSVTETVNLTLADAQKKELNRVSELMTSMQEAQAKLAGLKAPAVQTVSRSSVVKKAVIFAVLGAVAGAFLTVCVIWVAHITSGKIYSAQTLLDRTGVKTLCCVSSGKKKCPLDRFLRRLEGRTEADMQTQAQLLETDIRYRAKEASVLVTGSGSKESRQALVQALGKSGLQVRDCGSILTDPAALQALSECGAVVLVERCGASRYDSVNKQQEMIEDYNKQLLGCVLLDG